MNAPLVSHTAQTPHAAHSPSRQPHGGVQHGRSIELKLSGQEVMDGAGVRIQRLLTQELQARLDPWLLLDVFRSDDPRDYLAGFPEHPHRGFETITYMLHGRMRHRDSAGHEGLLESGGVQWMTAGRGVIHSEMPEQQAGLMSGIQLWLNLPASDKLCAPWYRDFQAHELPRGSTAAGVELRVIAGSSHGLHGLVERPASQPLYLHLSLPPASHFSQPLGAELNACVVVLQGQLEVVAGNTDTDAEGAGQQARHAEHADASGRVSAGELAVLANTPTADGVELRNDADAPCEVLLIAGRPLHEAIVQRGPFVMNSEAEIRQAYLDYRQGRFGT